LRLSERRCEACGAPADGAPSAHFARVVWLCQRDSEEFHAPELQQVLRHPSASTSAIWLAIDCWLEVTRAMRLLEPRLRLVRREDMEPPPPKPLSDSEFDPLFLTPQVRTP